MVVNQLKITSLSKLWFQIVNLHPYSPALQFGKAWRDRARAAAGVRARASRERERAEEAERRRARRAARER